MGNTTDRIDKPADLVTGPLAGETLLENFKAEMIKENVFQKMFGKKGERIFTKESPNANESITPFMILSWRNEKYSSNNVYLEGSIDLKIVLPVAILHDYNALRRVASIIQRWMGGSMDLFSTNPGLIRIGYESEYDFTGLAVFTGATCPMIQANIPFVFDLTLMRLQSDGFNPSLPLDASDEGFVETYLLKVVNQETDTLLIQEGVLLETGESN